VRVPLLVHTTVPETSLQHSMAPLVHYGMYGLFRGPKDDALVGPRIAALVDRRRKANAVFKDVRGVVCVHVLGWEGVEVEVEERGDVGGCGAVCVCVCGCARTTLPRVCVSVG
jgi:hypothetical protein